MPKTGKLTISAVAQIEKLILVGKLRPGERLVQRQLANTLRVSQATAGAVIVELCHRGLAVKPEGESAYVPSLGPDETREILAVRIPLEKLAFKLAAEKMTPEDLGEIEEVMETKAKDVYHFDYLFHEKIWETSGNRLLLRHLVQLVKPLFIGGFRVLNHDNTIKEHREIFRILKNQEAEEVQKAVGKHIANAWMTETGASLTAAAASP